MPDLQQIQIPGRCAACKQGAFDLLTLHTTHDQHPRDQGDLGWSTWYANDGDLVTCDCGARYVCRDLGGGRIEVVPEVKE